MSIKKWNNWKKISREEIPNIVKKKSIKKFSIEEKLRFKSKDIHNSQLLLNKEVPIKKIEKPTLCENCGHNITNNDYFLLYTPLKKIICRGCYQNKKSCLNCQDVIPPYEYQSSVPYCKDCKKKNTCDSCKKEKKIDELYRKKSIKGSYCRDCLSNSKSCLHCYKKIPIKEYICEFCFKESRLTRENIIKHIDTIITFYRKLDQDFKVPIRSRNIKIVESNDITHPSPLIQQPIYIQGTMINVVNTIKEKDIYSFFPHELCQFNILSWKNIQTDNAMKKILTFFLSFLFFSEKKIIILGEDINKIGNSYGKQYTFFKDMKEQFGPHETYKRIKKQFHE